MQLVVNDGETPADLPRNLIRLLATYRLLYEAETVLSRLDGPEQRTQIGVVNFIKCAVLSDQRPKEIDTEFVIDLE